MGVFTFLHFFRDQKGQDTKKGSGKKGSGHPHWFDNKEMDVLTFYKRWVSWLFWLFRLEMGVLTFFLRDGCPDFCLRWVSWLLFSWLLFSFLWCPDFCADFCDFCFGNFLPEPLKTGFFPGGYWSICITEVKKAIDAHTAFINIHIELPTR